MTKHHVTSSARLYPDMNPDCLLLVLILVVRGRQKNGFRVALRPCSPPQLHLDAAFLNITPVNAQVLILHLLGLLFWSAYGFDDDRFSEVTVRERSDPLEKVAEVGQTGSRLRKRDTEGDRLQLRRVAPRISHPTADTSTPTTHVLWLTSAKPSGQFCASPLQAALTLHDWHIATLVLPTQTTLQMSCFSPGWTAFGEAVWVKQVLPHLWACSIFCFTLFKRQILCFCHQQQIGASSYLRARPILWTSPCCHWSLPLSHLTQARLFSNIDNPPTSIASGLVHNFKDRVPLRSSEPTFLFCLNLPCGKSHNSLVPSTPVPGKARVKTSATETRCIWLGSTSRRCTWDRAIGFGQRHCTGWALWICCRISVRRRWLPLRSCAWCWIGSGAIAPSSAWQQKKRLAWQPSSDT